MDALHTTRKTASLITQTADDVVTVKGHAPDTCDILKTIDWDRDATGHVTEDWNKDHGRLEQRSIETTSIITSLDAETASPEDLLRTNRGHGSVDNRNHRHRDVFFAEDACPMRTGTGPANRARLNTLALAVVLTNRQPHEGFATARRRLQNRTQDASKALVTASPVADRPPTVPLTHHHPVDRRTATGHRFPDHSPFPAKPNHRPPNRYDRAVQPSRVCD